VVLCDVDQSTTHTLSLSQYARKVDGALPYECLCLTVCLYTLTRSDCVRERVCVCARRGPRMRAWELVPCHTCASIYNDCVRERESVCGALPRGPCGPCMRAWEMVPCHMCACIL